MRVIGHRSHIANYAAAHAVTRHETRATTHDCSMSITTYARHLDRCAGCRSRHTPGPYEGVSYMCDLPRRSAVRPRGLAVARKHASSLRALPPYCTRSRRVHCDSEPEESPHGERHPSCRASYPALSSHAHSPPIAVTLNRPSLSFSSARRPPLPPPCPLHSFNCRHQPTPSAICAPCPVCWWGLPVGGCVLLLLHTLLYTSISRLLRLAGARMPATLARPSSPLIAGRGTSYPP